MGIYPEVSLKLARRRRDEARKLLARDIDPSAYRKAQKRSKRQWARNSFEAVAAEWLAKHSPNWSTGYARRLESELVRDVFPYVGARPVAELTAPDLLAVVRRVEKRGHLRTAHNVLRTCGRVAALRGGDGPGRAGRVVGPARGATACQDEALRGDHGSEGGRSVAPAVGRLFRNASRTLRAPSCTAGVRAPRRVGDGGVGRHRPRGGRVALHGDEDRHATRPCPWRRQTVAILREVHPLTGHHRYVFPNARHPHRELPMSRGTLWSAFRALDIPRDRMTMHGFRAMARTILDEVLGFRPDFIEHQLAHAVRDPNGRAYNRTAVPARATRDDAGLGRLPGPASGRERSRAGDSRIGAFPHPYGPGNPERQLRARPSRQLSRPPRSARSAAQRPVPWTRAQATPALGRRRTGDPPSLRGAEQPSCKD